VCPGEGMAHMRERGIGTHRRQLSHLPEGGSAIPGGRNPRVWQTYHEQPGGVRAAATRL
jgi:hypothetical protein